ncbi:MAG: rhomboid family intramembrane serine protease [Crocinitomicaceae bacterium]|nr:rhomboid family intramembrane serine protease [Crocinitomicaceae bacterium]MBK8927295.1 rhomboid family intramembrane serine protease [Crocinitomicaceae bacterium]
MFQSHISRIAFRIALTMLFVMWMVYLIDVGFELHLYKYGILPRKTEGLVGIIAAPFLHSPVDFGHIFNNSIPAFVLTWLLFYHYRTIATQVFLLIFFLTGISMWMLARDSYHIGMSGVIYGLTSFLVLSGFFRKNMRVAAVSLFVIFIYGSMIWGIFPTAVNISWEGHALGFFSGIILAVIYKNKGPQPQKLLYEIQEEQGIEPEDEYWKIDDEKPENSTPEITEENPIPPLQHDPLIIQYIYKKKETEGDLDSEK